MAVGSEREGEGGGDEGREGCRGSARVVGGWGKSSADVEGAVKVGQRRKGSAGDGGLRDQ